MPFLPHTWVLTALLTFQTSHKLSQAACHCTQMSRFLLRRSVENCKFISICYVAMYVDISSWWSPYLEMAFKYWLCHSCHNAKSTLRNSLTLTNEYFKKGTKSHLLNLMNIYRIWVLVLSELKCFPKHNMNNKFWVRLASTTRCMRRSPRFW
jgi:hypothetical protein